MSDDNIIMLDNADISSSKTPVLDVETVHDLPADRVIEAAVGKMREVIVLGIDLDGHPYVASNLSDKRPILWHLEMAKHSLLESD